MTPDVIFGSFSEIEECDCGLYYSDPAIRERCIHSVFRYLSSRPDECGDIYPLLESLFHYIKTGELISEKDK